MVQEGKPKTEEEKRAKIDEIKETYFRGSTGTSVSKDGQTYAYGTGIQRQAQRVDGTPATSGGVPVMMDDEILTRERIEKERKAIEEQRKREEIKKQEIILVRKLFREQQAKGKKGKAEVWRGRRGDVVVQEDGMRKYFIAGGGEVLAPRSAKVRSEFVKRPMVTLRDVPETPKKVPTAIDQKISALKTGQELYAEDRARELAGFEEDVKAQQKRQYEFTTSKGFERINVLASDLTLGGQTPVEGRGEFGYQAEMTTRSLLGWGIGLGGGVASVFEKAYLFGKAVRTPAVREGFAERFTDSLVSAGAETAKLYRSYYKRGEIYLYTICYFCFAYGWGYDCHRYGACI